MLRRTKQLFFRRIATPLCKEALRKELGANANVPMRVWHFRAADGWWLDVLRCQPITRSTPAWHALTSEGALVSLFPKSTALLAALGATIWMGKRRYEQDRAEDGRRSELKQAEKAGYARGKEDGARWVKANANIPDHVVREYMPLLLYIHSQNLAKSRRSEKEEERKTVWRLLPGLLLPDDPAASRRSEKAKEGKRLLPGLLLPDDPAAKDRSVVL